MFLKDLHKHFKKPLDAARPRYLTSDQRVGSSSLSRCTIFSFTINDLQQIPTPTKERSLRACYGFATVLVAVPTKPKTHRPRQAIGKVHRPKRPSEQQVTQARSIRSTNRWRKLSEAKRRKDPLCEDPFGDHGIRKVGAQSVHHIQSVELRPDLAFEWANLMSVCNACHNRLDKSERGKRFNPKGGLCVAVERQYLKSC